MHPRTVATSASEPVAASPRRALGWQALGLLARSCSRTLEDQRGLLAHDSAGSRHVRGVVLAQLPVLADALNLAGRFDDHRHAAGHPRLAAAQHSPVGIAREVALVRQVVIA